MVDMAHFAGLVAGKAFPDPIPYADVVTSTTHNTLRGPRAGLILCRSEHAKAIDKAVFPGSQGGPLEHVISAKAVAFREALHPSFVGYCRQIIANAQALAGALSERGYHLVSGARARNQSSDLPTHPAAEEILTDVSGCFAVSYNEVP